MTFRKRAEAAALAWKRKTALLPDAARVPAPYFDADRPSERPSRLCLPEEFAELNLVPDARETGLSRFKRDGIRWHAGTPAGPSNHLLDSQVQCVNALAPLVGSPDAVRELFGKVLDIAEVLPFEPSSPDALVFEWIGLVDHLGEGNGKQRTRGSRTTSVDAAFRYRTPEGSIEIGLCEWKYTEKYEDTPLAGGDSAMATRIARYRQWWDDPHGPVRHDLIPYDDLFVEPFYQLFRQQVLAHEMERARELDADCVRVVYAAPCGNAELWKSLTRESHWAAGGDVRAAWAAMVRGPDRFVVLDTTSLAGPRDGANPAFVERYGAHFLADQPIEA